MVQDLTTITPRSVGQYREDVLASVEQLKAAGLSQNNACKEIGVDPATYIRWWRTYQKALASGEDIRTALEPRYANCGRRPIATLTEAEEATAKELFIKVRSVTTALRTLANLPQCSQATSDAILKRRSSKHKITQTLRDQVRLPRAVMEYHRSPKQTRLGFFINPRTLTYIAPDGQEKPILPGDLSERDDMSNNFLCWVPWPWGGDPCSDKFGVRIARGQNLIQIDVASLYFQSFLFLIRLRDSYRADDVWQWIGQTYRDIGMPHIGERHERGIWASKQIRGVALEDGHTGNEKRLGGITELGRRIIESHSPTTKIIENRFNFLQTVMATIPGQIGRSRGEMERENKLWTACRNGYTDPRKYFLSYEECCNQIEAKLAFVNSEPVEGTLYHGVPAEIYSQGITARPMEKLAPEKTWLFERDQRETTISKGHALVRYTTPEGRRAPWYFHNDNLWRHEGTPVHVYFDTLNPAAGGTIVARANCGKTKAGDVLGHADLVDGCPQFALGLQLEGGRGSEAAMDSMERRAAFNNAVRSEYRALGLGSRRLARVSQVNDGQGGIATVSSVPAIRGDRAEAPAPRPQARRAAPKWDEAGTLSRIEKMEAAARERGEIVAV